MRPSFLEKYYSCIDDIRITNIGEYLYAAKFGNRIKIGMTKTPKNRAEQIQNACGIKLNIIGVFGRFSNAVTIEKYIHHIFNEKRLYGEWFNIDFNDACIELRKTEIYSHIGKYKDQQFSTADLINSNIIKYKSIKNINDKQVLYSIDQVSNLLMISKKILQSDINTGRLKAGKIKTKLLIHIDDINNYVNLCNTVNT